MTIQNALKKNWTLRVLIILVLLVFVELAALSAAQYLAYNNTSTDISSMSQAIWSVAQGKPLVFTIEGAPLSRLGRHVEVIYFLFAPLYALFPSPITLLAAQAAFFVSGAFPLYRLAGRRLQSPGAALMLGAIYLFYPVAQTAVLFDFHGDTLAMPLLLWMIEAADRRSWRSYFIWLALALSCKVYVALPVAAFGAWLWFRGQRRIGGVSVLAALLWGGVAFFVVRPLFTPAQADLVINATPPDYFSYYFGNWPALKESLLPRLLTAILIFSPALVLGWRARDWLAMAGITAFPALASTAPGPAYYYGYHHYALSVPFLALAIFYGARAQSVWSKRQIYLGVSLTLVLMFNGLIVDAPLNPQFFTASPGSGRGLDLSGYGISKRDNWKTTWLAKTVPPDAPLAANALLLPHLLNRHYIYPLGKLTGSSQGSTEAMLRRSDYALVDALFDYAQGDDNAVELGGVLYGINNLQAVMRQPDFQLQRAQDGLLLFSRRPNGLLQKAETLETVDAATAQVIFGAGIILLAAEITPQGKTPFGEALYQAKIDWMTTQKLPADSPYIAVSRVEGLEHARIVHLPTIAIFPTTSWTPHQLVRETFQFTLPADTPPGTYPLLTGWYRTDSIFSAQTDIQTRLGDEAQIGRVTVP